VDPVRTAFFARLAALDYPATMRTLQWMLPEDPSVADALGRSILLRNLCADFTAELHQRFPTLRDIRRLAEIVSRFDRTIETAALHDARVRENFGRVLEQIAGVAGKVLNPSTSLGAPLRAIEDAEPAAETTTAQRGSLQEAFADRPPPAPAQTGGHPASPRFSDVAQPPEPATSGASGASDGGDYGFYADAVVAPELADACTDLLRAIFAASLRPAFAPDDIEARRPFAGALGDVLGSALWQRRAVPGEGRASSPLDDAALTERARLAEELDRLLAAPVLEQDDLGIACALISSLIYAEWGGELDRSERAVAKIEQLLSLDRVSKPTAIQAMTSFLGNHIHVYYVTRMDQATPEQIAGFVTRTTGIVRELARRYHPDDSMAPGEQSHMASAVADAYSRLGGLTAQLSSPSPTILARGVEELQKLTDRLDVQLTSDIAGLYVGRVEELAGDEAARAVLLDSLAELATVRGVDRQSFVNWRWEQQRWVLFTLAFRCAGSPRAIDRVLGPLLQAGRGMGLAFRSVLLESLPRASLDAQQTALLRRHARSAPDGDAKPGDSDPLVACFWAQDLMNGAFGDVLTAVESLWRDGHDWSSVRSRTLALRGLALVLDFDPPETAQLTRLIDRLGHTPALRRRAVGDDSDRVDLDSRATDEHDAALSAAIASCAWRAINAGRDPEPPGGRERMTEQEVRELDERISRALRTRIQTSEASRDEMLADLQRLRAITARTGRSEQLHAAIAHVLLTLGPDDSLRAALQAEIEVDALSIHPSPRTAATASRWRRYDERRGLDPDRRSALLDRGTADAEVWPFPEAFRDAWAPLDGDAFVTTVDRLLAAHPEAAAEPVRRLLHGTVAARFLAPHCYPGFRLVEVLLDPRPLPVRSAVFLMRSDGCVQLNGSSDILHALDQQGALDVSTTAAATQYLQLFCAFVQGDDGPFHIVSDPDVMRSRWKGATAQLEEILATIEPLNVQPEVSSESDVAWRAEAPVLYGTTLFRVTFQIRRSGIVDMVEDEPIAGALAVTGERFRNGWRVPLGVAGEGRDSESAVATSQEPGPSGSERGGPSARS
jgi:hypothetical protein